MAAISSPSAPTARRPAFPASTCNRTIYLAYILSSTCAAFVGLLLASRIGIGNATQAEGWELQAIASSVIGGTSLFGAVGSVHGPLLGAFILATINNGANLLNVNSFWQRIITGVLIIVIVYFDQLRRRGRGRGRLARDRPSDNMRKTDMKAVLCPEPGRLEIVERAPRARPIGRAGCGLPSAMSASAAPTTTSSPASTRSSNIRE